MQDNPYLFQSERLGFRNWSINDLDEMYAINSNKEVMEFFPRAPTKEETNSFISRMQKQFEQNQFCYFAVEKTENREFIGFIGISTQDYEADFTPCIDIGWRIKKSAWHKGYATEGAKATLDYAFNKLQLKHIYAIAPAVNTRSEAVMKKIGMSKVKNFIHPQLINDKRLGKCVLYEIKAVI
ncbi:GNAT family N-acetyltransferase [Fulvivirga sp. 29W222]|uniref:GNAT family N-acetyltransferase n=1 Tax=Fulvivirga marina TaxID=2494733 RepID=A0A937FV64_9BACT|nr:GNAT family N-acetyltransferase [Fulvivirga marina]MBL6445122.1 GNAT family N-acetyltransferase [Fulvivirga marina]